jgi:hypothetical protein
MMYCFSEKCCTYIRKDGAKDVKTKVPKENAKPGKCPDCSEDLILYKRRNLNRKK